MDVILQRKLFKPDGIFGCLYSNHGKFLCYTLEHSYHLAPKVPEGDYECIRGLHRLKHEMLDTFEVTDVPNHQGILFHPGNKEEDSEGCILLGMEMRKSTLADSRLAFKKFMDLQKNTNDFILTVENNE